MKLENIGFYTLSDYRAKNLSDVSPMYRGEIIITDKCNFSCNYCRKIEEPYSGVMDYDKICETIDIWASHGLKNIRFSGGEPTLHPRIIDIISKAKDKGIERIALSTNGSNKTELYLKLYEAGVNDFSISLDACCASFGDKMAGKLGVFDSVVKNIEILSKIAYVTVGVVLTNENYTQMNDIVKFAAKLGVSDIRVIPSAQENFMLQGLKDLDDELVDRFPILKYRVTNLRNNVHVRGIETVCDKCFILNDDSAVVNGYHFPCIIYFREHGKPIGKVGPGMRAERIKFMETFRPDQDEICKKNCLDCLVYYNNRVKVLKSEQ